MRYTILGSSGFVGRHLERRLRQQGHEVVTPGRDNLFANPRAAGHLVYCIGFTGNFREHLGETVDAHVTLLRRCLAEFEFDSFLFLSSTRVYGSQQESSATSEDDPVCVRPTSDSVYDLSKLLGEALVLAQANPAARVARLSNVIGPGMSRYTFLGSVLEDLRRDASVTIGEDPESSKDYIHIDEVVELLIQVASGGSERLYNIAAGRPTTHGQLAELLHGLGGYTVTFAPHGERRVFPTIDNSRIQREFGYSPRPIDASVMSHLLA
jgi:nucleoside-diphosphate-sugar epimerase